MLHKCARRARDLYLLLFILYYCILLFLALTAEFWEDGFEFLCSVHLALLKGTQPLYFIPMFFLKSLLQTYMLARVVAMTDKDPYSR